MDTRDWDDVPPMTAEQRKDALADLALIARGEELDMPWRRLRILLDHKLVEINHPVLTQGSRTSVGFTGEGSGSSNCVNLRRRRSVHLKAVQQADRNRLRHNIVALQGS